MSTLWLTPSETIDPAGPYTMSAIEAASLILYKLSGEKYPGVYTVTEAYNSENFSGIVTRPEIVSGNMVNLSRMNDGFRNLRLRHSPVRSIDSIEFLGSVMDPSEYSLRNNAYIVRRNSLPWLLEPTNDLIVTYVYGTPPPSMGRRAARRLANEFILSDQGSAACALPERITSVNRQGISYTIMDPQEFISNGRVGIYEVDLFLAAVNPNKAKKKPKIFSVDRPRGERIN